KEWKKSDFVLPLPPNPVKTVGKPRKTGRLEPDEPVQKKKKRKPALIFKEGSNKIKRQQTTVKCGKCGVQGRNVKTCKEPVTDAASQVMGRNGPVQECPNEPVAEVANIPQKLKGYIPPTSAFKLPPKATTTAPTMFEQFKQCQKGVKIRQPASFVDDERKTQEQASLG
ncbi:UNVERIFIED_CONTAM: hypothetical protein Sindi_2670300, partial [Sesamum indicum]